MLFTPDPCFQNWFAGIENLDAVVWEAVIHRIEADSSLGADPEARRQRMRHAFRVVQIQYFLALGVLILYQWQGVVVA